MKKNQPLILIILVLVLSTLACNLPLARDLAGATEVEPSIQELPPAQGLPDAAHPQPTTHPLTELPSEDTPTPTSTATVTPTDTPLVLSLPLFRIPTAGQDPGPFMIWSTSS